MDKIEKIRQEIERRLNILTNVYDELMERKDEEMMTYYHGKVIALEELCPFLDTLSEEPDKSLEEEIRKYLSDRWKFGCCTPVTPVVLPNYTTVDLKECANHFAQWQKSQMLKDAYVESQIVEDGRIELEGNPLPCLNPIILLPYPQFEPGDKVKVIVLKNNEDESK